MIDFVFTPLFLGSALRVAMVTMHFNIAQTGLFLGNIVFRILGISVTKLAPIKNCPVGEQGRSNWIPGFIKDNR